ncbi:MAG: glycosyltransferase family 2 protein [Hyphomonas sp.]|nr:glycosyltransferase family 2 protein [Hyphomonas sp.]
MSKALKISYCTTCKGRLHHLRQTLPANMAAEAGNDDIEFVLLDYDSNDGLGDWVRDTFRGELASGRLVYVRHAPAPHFRMAHAKNMSHRAASGDVLVNVDGDNFIAPNTSAWLRALFVEHPNSLACPRELTVPGFLQQRYLNRFLNRPRPADGLCGRIAVSRATFHAVGGYNEGLLGWGGDDVDFMLRVRDSGARLAAMPVAVWGGTIPHDNEERIANMPGQDQKVSLKRLQRSLVRTLYVSIARIMRRHEPLANAETGFGCGQVVINWEQAVQFTPDASPMRTVA